MGKRLYTTYITQLGAGAEDAVEQMMNDMEEVNSGTILANYEIHLGTEV